MKRVGEGGSCVITAGQPSQILIKITKEPFVREAGRRIGWEPACSTLANMQGVPPEKQAQPLFPSSAVGSLPWQMQGTWAGPCLANSPLQSSTEAEHLP